jgi:hypothetical protein
MATYLQGVTDYIPDYQPFQPDLNFYGNLLQAKQSQYDSNWKNLNNLYSSLYGAELTHKLNIEKKDELLKQIDFNLKRVSSLDLSLEENVNQAMQVFKPFYEDKYLMRDMAYTKNFTNTVSRANSLKTSKDDKQRKQWWQTGIDGLEIRRQMFRDATLEETLGMSNVDYTPNAHAIEDYMNLASKFKVGAVQQLPDKSGLYLVRQKNGQLILPTLQNMFLAEYSNRPDIQAKYKEEAFVERMNYAYTNKEKFGTVLDAEKDYITSKYEYIKTYAKNRNNVAKDELETNEQQIADVEKEINNNDIRPQQFSYLDRLNEGLKVSETVHANASQLNQQVNDQKSGIKDGEIEDILSDLEVARYKIDSGMTAIKAEKDIMSAANTYATTNYELEYKPNPVGLAFLNHNNALSRQREANLNKLDQIQKDHENKMFQKAVDQNLKSGYWSFDKDGKLVTNPQANGFNLNFLMPNEGGNTEGKFTFDDMQELSRTKMLDGAQEGGDHLMKTIQNGVNSGTFTAAQIAFFLRELSLNKADRATVDEVLKKGGSANKPEMVRLWKNMWSQYSKNNNTFIKGLANTGQLYNLNEAVTLYAEQHAGSKFTEMYSSGDAALKLNQLARVEDALSIVRSNNISNIKNKFSEDLNRIVAQVKAKDPKTYANVTQDKIDQAVDLVINRYALDGKGHLEEFKKIAPEIDKQISSILGFSIGKSTNQKTESKWYNYVFPLTNITRIFGDGRETVKDQASWISDVFDNSFEEVTKMDSDKGGLSAYFPNIVKSGTGNQYGIASETGMVKVAPGTNWDPGNQAAASMFTTILATLWSQDKSKYRITTEGNIKPADPDDPTGISESEALAIAAEMKLQLNSNKDLKPFFVGASTVAMENEKLGSMKLMAPREVIEKVIKSMSEGGKEEEIKAKIDKIYQNGITYIAPQDVWSSNKLYGRQFPSATEILLKTGPYTYKDPSGSGEYTIQKSPGASDYISNISAYEMMPDGSKVKHDAFWKLDVRSGKEIDEKELQNKSMIDAIKVINFQRFQQIVRSGDQTKIEAAKQNFGATVNNPFWNFNNR